MILQHNYNNLKTFEFIRDLFLKCEFESYFKILIRISSCRFTWWIENDHWSLSLSFKMQNVYLESLLNNNKQ